MVGLKPPLPRTFSFFRFSTAFATILLMLTFAANSILPRVSFSAAAPMAQQEAYGIGGGSGGGCNEPCSPPVLVPVATEAPLMDSAVAPAEILPSPSEDAFRVGQAPIAETPAAKGIGNTSAPQDQTEVTNDALIPASWQIVLLIAGLLSALIMFALRQSAIRKWK